MPRGPIIVLLGKAFNSNEKHQTRSEREFKWQKWLVHRTFW